MSSRDLEKEHYDILDAFVKLESLGEEWSSAYDIERMVRADNGLVNVKAVGKRLGTLYRRDYAERNIVNQYYYYRINDRGRRLIELERPSNKQQVNPVQVEMDLSVIQEVDEVDHIPAAVVITIENASGFILSSRSFDVGLGDRPKDNSAELKALRDELSLIKRKISASVLEAFLEAGDDR